MCALSIYNLPSLHLLTLQTIYTYVRGLKTDAAAQAMIKRAKRQKKFKNMAAQRKKMVGKFNIY